jgi:TIR domain
VRKDKFLILISSVTPVILLLIACLVSFSAAQMMMSPTPTPTPAIDNSAVSFVFIGIVAILSVAIIAIYLFYSRNKRNKTQTFSKPKFSPIIGRNPTVNSKIDTSAKLPRPFDVFLCYKKSSGKDYADHLKTGLEELGLHTFQDCRDIPLTVDTDEGWACSRDKALEECKYFILIMTPGFELSREVVKEISLARKQGNKTFVFFRHRSMARNIVVDLGDEILDIGNLSKSLLRIKKNY